MYRDYQVITPYGVHCRNAAQILKLGSELDVKVEFEPLDSYKNTDRCLISGMMALLTLELSRHEKVRVYCEGTNSEKYLEKLVDPEIVYDIIDGQKIGTFRYATKTTNLLSKIGLL